MVCFGGDLCLGHAAIRANMNKLCGRVCVCVCSERISICPGMNQLEATQKHNAYQFGVVAEVGQIHWFIGSIQFLLVLEYDMWFDRMKRTYFRHKWCLLDWHIEAICLGQTDGRRRTISREKRTQNTIGRNESPTKRYQPWQKKRFSIHASSCSALAISMGEKDVPVKQWPTERNMYQKAPKIENGICNEMLTLKTMHNNVAVLAGDQLSVSTWMKRKNSIGKLELRKNPTQECVTTHMP